MKKPVNSALPTRALRRLRSINTADILVGVPSYNNAHTINYVVYQAAKGLETHFPNMKSVILISDGKSTDGTLATVKAMRLPFRVKVIPTTYTGISGKGTAVKAIFEAAIFLNAKAVALIDSDLRSVTPTWIDMLISPTFTGTGFVTPFYLRHKYDGTITNFLCYPATSCLYGCDIRQPIGGDFGLSIDLVEELLESQLWQTDYVPRFGIDIFETHTALAKKFKVKQVSLGAKVHEAKDPGAHLGPMFRQVVGSMFACAEHYEKAWRDIRGSRKIEIISGKMHAETPEAVQVDSQDLLKEFEGGFEKNRQVYRTILSDRLLKEVESLKTMSKSEISFPSETWAKVVFSFLAGFKREAKSRREKLLDALRILWIGKVATFVKETLELDTAEAEKEIEEQARVFEELKPYLLDIFCGRDSA